jgi:hypothetical protein
LDANKFLPYPEEYAKKDREVWGPLHAWEDRMTKELVSLSFEEREQWRKDNPAPSLENDGYNNGGYDWCIRFWGCKWNFSNVEVREEPDALTYIHDSANSPLTGVVKKMGEMFQRLRFELRYEEPGCCFQGTLIMQDGEVLEDECHEYTPYYEEDELPEIPKAPTMEKAELDPRYIKLGKERRGPLISIAPGLKRE